VDLYFEELRQIIFQKRTTESENNSVSEARQRQYRFLIGEHESKIKAMKIENDRLEKDLNDVRVKEEYNKKHLYELELKLKEFDAMEEGFERLRKAKMEADKKLMDTESRVA
jgi:hypothetical protein